MNTMTDQAARPTGSTGIITDLMMGGIGRTVMAAQVEIIHDTATMTRTGHHPTDIMMPDASPTTMGVLGGTTTTDKGVTTEYMGVAQETIISSTTSTHIEGCPRTIKTRA